MTCAAHDGKAPPVVCVVLNWNGWTDTVPCVVSLLGQVYPSLEVVIVDNASTDDSVDQIRRLLPTVRLLCAAENRGFAAGCNEGIEWALQAGAEFIWLLNNDTVVPPDTLGKLMGRGAADQRVGLVGSVLHYADHPDRVQAWGGGAVSRRTGYNTHLVAPADLGDKGFLTFASVLIRRDVLLTAGLLDEGFFMYYEDADLCFRARAAGWTLAVAAETRVLHKEGSSRRKRRKSSTDRMVTASGLRFLYRHGQPAVLAMLLFLILRLGRRVQQRDFGGVRSVLQGAADWHAQRHRDVLPAPPRTNRDAGSIPEQVTPRSTSR